MKYSHQCDYSWCGYMIVPINLFCYYWFSCTTLDLWAGLEVAEELFDHCYDDMIDIKYGESECTLYRLFKAHFCQSLNQLQSVSLLYNSTCYVTTYE